MRYSAPPHLWNHALPLVAWHPWHMGEAKAFLHLQPFFCNSLPPMAVCERARKP
jgi:hypothetical protein